MSIGYCRHRFFKRQGRRRPFQRQREPKDRTAARAVLGLYLAAVQLHDASADGQAQARSRASFGIAGPIELLEQAVRIAGRQSGTTVGYLDHDRIVLMASGDFNGRAGRRVAGRIFQQIDQHLLNRADRQAGQTASRRRRVS